MPLEKWSEDVYLVRLAEDPQLTDELTTLEQAVGGKRCKRRSGFHRREIHQLL